MKLKIDGCGGSTNKNDTGLLFLCCSEFNCNFPFNTVERSVESEIDLYHHKYKFRNVLIEINPNFTKEHKQLTWRTFFEKDEEYDPFTILYTRQNKL